MSIRRATQTTISFPLIDAANRPARDVGIVFASGHAKISKDGGAFTATTNLPTEISQGRYALTLTAAEMDAAWVHVLVEAPGSDPWDHLIGTSGDPTGTIIADGGNVADSFKTDRAESTTDHWKNVLIIFTTGTLAGQVAKVSGYDGTTKFVSTALPFTATPSPGDRFRFLND